jgi:N-acetylmuramoyl-L-alanine amidase
MLTAEMYSSVLLALAIFREARGSSRQAKLAVKHVILNRVAHPSGPFSGCHDVVSNILAPFQFSSFNPKDPNSSLLPNPRLTAEWPAWLECCEVVDSNEADITGGANYYFDTSIKPPSWADPKRHTVDIDTFRFYRL